MSKTAGADIQVIQYIEQSRYPMDALGKLMMEICVTSMMICVM